MKLSTRFFLGSLILALISGVTATALAQASGGSPSARLQSNATGKKPERKQNLSFEDELVTGASEKPELFYLFQKKNFNYKRLIRLREDFIPEMRKTSEEIQRSRSAN